MIARRTFGAAFASVTLLLTVACAAPPNALNRDTALNNPLNTGLNTGLDWPPNTGQPGVDALGHAQALLDNGHAAAAQRAFEDILAAYHTTDDARAEPGTASDGESHQNSTAATGTQTPVQAGHHAGVHAIPHHVDDAQARIISAATMGLGEALLAQGDITGAVKAFAPFVGEPGYRAAAHQGLGRAHLASGQLDLAKAALADAVAADATLWRAWVGLARIYDQIGDVDQAETAYRMALQATDRPGQVYNNYGFSLISRQHYGEALAAFDAALAHNPDLEIARVNRSLVLAMAGEYAKLDGAGTGERAARDLNNAGYVAMMRGEYDVAYSLFSRALQASPVFFAPAFENMQTLEHKRVERR